MGRKYCEHCCKPEVVCLCECISKQANTWPVLVLQHPDEQKKPLSSVPLIKRGLDRVEIVQGLNFSEAQCRACLARYGVRHPILLYPDALAGSNKHRILDCEKEQEFNQSLLSDYDSLIVLDGTWRNTRELVLINTWLRTYPTMGLVNAGQSRYRIRKASQKASLSTIEALSRVISIVDEGFQAPLFLLPFERMIDQQIQFMGDDVFQRNYR